MKCYVADTIEVSSRARVEIEMKKVGTVNIVAAGVPGVEIDAPEVDDPEKGREVLHDRKINDVPRVVFDGAGLDPLRVWDGDSLHVEELALRSVRVSLHDHGPVLDVRQKPLRYVRVILEQVAFLKAEILPERFSQVRQLNQLRPELESDVGAIVRDLYNHVCVWSAVFRMQNLEGSSLDQVRFPDSF